MHLLEVKNLHVEVDGKQILNGLDLSIGKGGVHAIMGPNGSGKSTLAHVLAGKEDYVVTAGEVLQMAILRPKLAILDETDSGLDIDALKIVADGVNAQRGPDFSALVITHYQRLLDYIVPDRVHVLVGGRIIRSGGPELAHALEAGGYASMIEEAA